MIDMCNGRFMETSVQISIKSKLPLAKGIRITEALSGKRYTVGLLTKKFKVNWCDSNLSVRKFCISLHGNPKCGQSFCDLPLIDKHYVTNC